MKSESFFDKLGGSATMKQMVQIFFNKIKKDRL